MDLATTPTGNIGALLVKGGFGMREIV